MANTKKYVSLDKLGLYDEKIKKVVTDGDAAALQSAKDYADSLAVNYDAAGSAATEAGKVQAELDKEVVRAKAREDEIAGLVATAQGEVDALELVVAEKAAQADLTALANKVGEVPADKTVMGIIEQIQENAYDDTALKAEINGKLDLKADKTQVATDIENAVKAEKEARESAVAGVQGAVDALSGTHATDKKALEDAIALKANQSALDELVAAAATKVALEAEVERATKEEARIAGLVEAEATKAREEEGKLNTRLVKVEAFFEGAAEDEGEGENLKNALDTLVEIQTYIDNDGAAADQMVKDIAANKKAIEDHAALDHDFAAADEAVKTELNAEIAKKADKTTVEGIDGRLATAEGKVTTVEGKVATLEGQMTTVQGAVATKAEKTYVDGLVETLEGVDAGQESRIAALEAKFGEGEGNVEDMIAEAKQAAIDAAAGDATTKANKALEDAKKYADEEDAKIESSITTLQGVVDGKAAQADLTALAGRVTTAEGEIDTLQTEMDAVEALAAANKAAHEANAAAIALKASQADLEAVSGRVTALETWHESFTEASEEEINNLFKA